MRKPLAEIEAVVVVAIVVELLVFEGERCRIRSAHARKAGVILGIEATPV